MAVLGSDGVPLRTMTCPIPVNRRPRLRGAHRARSLPPQPGAAITSEIHRYKANATRQRR